MKTSITLLLGAAALAAGALALTTSDALAGAGQGSGRMFAVTITNLTPNQIFSPPLLATHSDALALFSAGAPASPELAQLAENGDNVPLRDALLADSQAGDVQAASDPIMPGMSTTYLVAGTSAARRLSAAGMLVSTNDTFFALDGVALPRSAQGGTRYLVPAWDAGSEANSEDCAFVPGPPCGAGPVHDPSPAEGFVHISAGIHGIGGVPQGAYDWRNPVALISIERL